LADEEKLITDCKKKLASEFEMKDLDPMHYFLGQSMAEPIRDFS
jgi:hypothetical protein